MSSYLLQTPPPALKVGDYTTLRGSDTEAERDDIRRVLKRQGCKSVRFEPITSGQVVGHGYLAADIGTDAL